MLTAYKIKKCDSGWSLSRTGKMTLPKGAFSLNKLNAAQFSKMFKGTFILQQRFGLRGSTNRILNKSVSLFNKQVEGGNIFLK